MPLEKLAEDAQDAVPVKKITFAEKYAEAGRDFVEAKTITEAEEYAQRFVASYKSKYSGDVSYKGMDVSVANDINRVLTKIYELFDVEPLRNIKPMNKRENQWKDTTAEAAYQWFQGDLFINAAYYKNAKTIASHRAEVETLTRQVLANVDAAIAYAKTQEGVMARKKLAYVTALKETGRSNVGHIDVSDIITHEMGHMLDDRIFRKSMQTKGFDRSASYEKYAGGISAYATADGKEYIAESFAAWAMGDTDCLDPEVIAMFEEVVRWED